MNILKTFFVMVVLLTSTTTVQAQLTIDLDYSLDSNNFFGSAGSSQRLALEAARDVFEETITQSFNAITPGEVFNTGTDDEFTNTWTANFIHPGTGNPIAITDRSIAADTIVIYVGGRELGGSTLGEAGPGGFTSSGIGSFIDSVVRGNSSETFATWGGAASFDSVDTVWNFDLAGPVAGENDFYSVALHELAHVLGLAVPSDAFDDHFIPGTDPTADENPGTNGQFTGANALAAYNADNGLSETFVPLVAEMLDDPGTPLVDETSFEDRHFAEGLTSNIFGTTTLQEALLDPTLTLGTRKELTNVDVGALLDIGFELRVAAIPEPASATMIVLAAVAISTRRRRPA